MSEIDGNSRKRASSSVSAEDGSTGTLAGTTTTVFTTFPPSVITAAPVPVPMPASAATNNRKRHKKGARTPHAAGAQMNVPPGVVISRSAEDCAPQLTLSKDQLIVTGNRGFRMARATHGVSHGTWYWECTVLPPESRGGHCRLGWSLPTGSLQAPVGYDKSSYAYRDMAGSKVHESLRTDNYGEPWGPGDVIGFMIKLKSPSLEDVRDRSGPTGGEPGSGRLSVAAAAATLAAAATSTAAGGGGGKGGGGSSSERAAAGGSGANAGNEIRFFKNGKDQNVAFDGINPGLYFPAVSVYMGGSVRVNFGPEFVYPPPSSHRCKAIASLRPLSKDEAKAQRTRTKQERAARGLETATRQSAGGSYLGSTSRSPPCLSPWQQPPPATLTKRSSSGSSSSSSSAQLKAVATINENGAAAAAASDKTAEETRPFKTIGGHGDDRERADAVERKPEMAASARPEVIEARRASSPPAGSGGGGSRGGDGSKGGKNPVKYNGDEDATSGAPPGRTHATLDRQW